MGSATSKSTRRHTKQTRSLPRIATRKERETRSLSLTTTFSPRSWPELSPISGSLQPCNGRYYSSSLPYMQPVDAAEFDRIDQEHYLLRFVLQSNYCAVLTTTITRCLDVGCGPGTWLMEMAREFTQAQWTGIDAHNVFPVFHLHNCTFHQMNILGELSFPSDHFSYVHHRLLATSIPTSHYKPLIKQYYRIMQNNATIEICETDYKFLRTGPIGEQINAWLSNANDYINLLYIRQMPCLLEEAGFIEVEKKTFSFPLGQWNEGFEGFGLSALSNVVSLLQGLRAQTPITTPLSANQMTEWRDECDQFGTYMNFKVYLGKKRF